MKGNKIMSTLVAALMVMSAIVVISNVTDFKLVGNAGATTVTMPDVGTTVGIGFYPGQEIEYEVRDNSLNASAKYYVKVWNGTEWRALDVVSPTSQKSDAYGDLAFTIRVPGWDELGKNPLLGVSGNYDGQWNIALFDSTGTWEAAANTTITIGNLYDVRMYHGGTMIDHVPQNVTDYYGVTFEVYNWTGSTFEQMDGETYSYIIYDADGTPIYPATGTPQGSEDYSWYYDFGDEDTDYFTGGNLENNLWINVTNTDSTHQYSNITIPVKLNMTFSIIPSDNEKEWGDTVTVKGYLYNGKGNSIGGYPVKLYSPTSGNTYGVVDSATTQGSGLFLFEVKTGSGTGKDDVAGAGTWYVGTERTGTFRVDETNTLDITNFISYASFDVATKDDAQVRVRNTDDIISGFEQTINVSVYNSSWMNEDEYKNMQIHVTGLKGYYGGNEYDDDDKVLMSTSTWTDSNENYCYYTFDWRFNETGTATVIATWPGNDETIQKTTNVPAGVDNDEEDLLVNISGSKTFTVVSPDDINMIVRGTMVDSVQVTETGDLWQNGSDTFIINIYADTQDEVMNATLEITGCGLDILINESDTPTENDNLVAKPVAGGNYTVRIAPKTAGTLTIKATNGTDNYTATKDYTIYGLSGSVTTSGDDDLEIEVGSTETITATVTNGQYAEVHLTLFDENWAVIGSSPINDTVGDNTAGNGLNGIFEFNPDVDYLDDTIGYIVVVAKAGGYYMYDIVEITPVYDLTVTMTSPTAGNQTHTAGIEQDITVQITNPDGDVVDDIDTVTGEIQNEDGDTLQTITFSEDGDYWKVADQILWFDGTLKITAKNNTNQAEHQGSSSTDVGLATVTYEPGELTCAVGVVNQTIEVTAVDALGNALPEDTRLYLHKDDAAVATLNRDYVDLDADGAGEFKVEALGDIEGVINATLQDNLPTVGNTTLGKLTISFPVFTIDPETIYIGQSNIVSIWAKDANGDAIQGINLTLFGTGFGSTDVQPDPVETDSDGKVMFSIQPASSGILNVTIARNVHWSSGDLEWTNAVRTDSYITIDALSTFTIAVSKSPIYQGETLTVTVTSGKSPVSGVDVSFGEMTGNTDSSGEVDFTVPDPGVESAIYTVTAEKAGYITKEKTITVIKVYELSATASVGSDGTTVTVTAILIGKGPAVGATVTFNDKTETTDANGEVTFTAPAVEKNTDYTATVEYDDKTTAATVTITPTPGFELLTLIAAIGVAFILLRRRRNK